MSDPHIFSWDDSPARIPWSQQLRESVKADLVRLEQGNPEGFISGYGVLPDALKIKFWAELLIAMAWRESNWKPGVIYHEPPPLGVDSVGLLQLSYEDEKPYKLEKLDRKARSLEDPLVNLRCAVKILSKLVAQDKVVQFSGKDSYKGSPRYWSVMRKGAKHHLEEIRAKVTVAVGL